MNETAGRHSGTTLIELMISLTIVSLLVIGLTQIYLKIKASYRFQQALLETQENGRFVAHLLRAQIRGAGFIGCLKFDASLQLNFPPLQFYKAEGRLWQPNLPPQLQGKVKPATDVIQIQGVGPNLSSLTRVMENQHELRVSKEQLFQVGDALIIADCLRAQRFTIAAVTVLKDSQILISYDPLKFRYEQFATVGKLRRDTYYIREASWTNQSGDNTYSLYKMDLNNTHLELVPGIEAMTVTHDQSQAQDDLKDIITVKLLLATVARVNSGASRSSSEIGNVIAEDNHFYLPLEVIVSLR